MTEETGKPTSESKAPATETPKPPAADTPKPPISKASKWRRRLIRAGIAVIVIALLLRASLGLLLPWAINRAAAQFDLTCTYDHMDLYLLEGDVGLWHLVVAPKEGGTPFLKAEYCRGDISTFQLLRGHLLVQQAVADGAEVNLERQADGKIPLLDRLTMARSSSKTVVNSKTGTIDLSPPLQIDALRLQHVTAHIRDLAVTPAVDAQFDMDLRLSDLGSTARPAKLWMEASSSPLLDVLRVEGEGSSANQSIDANLHFFIRGLHAKPATGYLAPLGIRPVAESVSVVADAGIKLTALPNQSAFSGGVSIEKIMVSADGQPAVAVDRIGIDATSVGAGTTQFSNFSIAGVRVNADRTSDGSLRFAGFELATPPATAKSNAPAATPPAIPSFTLQIPFHLGEFALSGVSVSFHDQAVVPPNDLRLDVPSFSVKNLDTDSTHPQIATIDATLQFPGMLRSATMKGTATPFAERKTADLKFQVDGLRPAAIRPYLDALGIQSELKDASLTAQVNAALSSTKDGMLATDARVHDIHFRDGAALLDLDEIKIKGLAVDPALTRIAVDDFEITGPKFAAKRDVNGVLSALGFQLDPKARKTRPVEAGGSRDTSSVTTASPATPISLPRIDLHHFAWKGVQVQLDDATVQPATSLTLSDAGIELSELHLDPRSKTAHGSPGKLRASLKAPGLAGNLLVDGTLTPIESGLSGDFTVAGNGIRTAVAAPYLRGLGIEPLMQDGSLHLLAKFDIQSEDRGLKASGSISDFTLAENGKTLVSVGSAGLSGVELTPTSIAVDSVEVDKPKIEIEREAAGTLRAAGLRLLRPGSEAPDAAPTTSAGSNLPVATQPAIVVAVPSAPPVISLHHLKVTGAALTWSDQALTPAITANGSADVTLEHFRFAPDAAPADLKVTAKADGILDELTVGGTVLLQPTAAQAKLSISATGIRQGVLGAYLPPGLRVILKAGRAKAGIEVDLGENPAGGQKAMLIATDVDYRDGDSESSLFKVDSAKVIVSRLDVPGNICAIDEVSVSGLETGADRSAENEIQLLGLSLGQPAPVPGPTTAPAPMTEPVAQEKPGPATRPALSAEQIVAEHHRVFPLLTLTKLDLGVSKITVQDLSRPKSAPLVLTAQVRNRSPIILLGKDPAANSPVAIRIVGTASPLIGGFLADLDLTPFAQQPGLQLDVTAGGIEGAGLTSLVPELVPYVDGTHLTDGYFHTHIDGQVKLVRQSPIDVDFSRPFDVDFDLKDLAFRDGGAGPLLGGLEEVRSEGVHVDLTKQSVQVRSLEISTPAANAFRDTDGIHAFGLVVKLPANPQTQPSQTQPATLPTETVAQTNSPASTQPAAPQGTEIQIAKLLVNGLDVRYEDRAVSPVAVVHLNGLDAEVRDLSSRLLQEDKPVRFNVLVNAGKVSLPKHRTIGAISGAMADLRAMQAGKKIDTAPVMEERELFSQLDAAGNFSLYPKPKGWIKSSLSGFELGEFKGLAKAQGITLEEGTFDYSADIRGPGDGSVDVKLRPVLTDLQVTEPPNGPIVRMMHFSAPLDVVLAALRDPEGSIAFPLNIPFTKEEVEQGKINRGAVIDAGIAAVGKVVFTALAAAPVKVASAAVDTVSDVVSAFTPFGFFFKKPPPEKPLPIAFLPGETSVGAADLVEISAIIEKLKKNDKLDLTVRHELSAGDVARASLRANPSADDARRLVGQLRGRRAELLQLRASLIGRGRFELASESQKQDSQTIAQLRAVEQELAGVEDGLDQMYELLRPGADRLAVRRTRQVALQIADARVAAVRATLLGSGVPDIEKRLHVTHPQFTPSDSTGGGTVTLLIIKKK